MPDKKNRGADAETTDPTGGTWPSWGVRLVSVLLVVHLTAILAGAWDAPPASMLEREVAHVFSPYLQLIDQGYAYRYYAPEPGPTPVVTATIRYQDGRPDETVRIPERGTLPRLRYQRQLALANHLATDVSNAKMFTGEGARSHYARSYARHLARSRKGCASVTLFIQQHFFPPVEQVDEILSRRPASRLDLDAEEFFSAPERIGEFPCEGL